MASITSTQAGYLALNFLNRGIAESTITIDRFYEVLPWLGFEGNAYAYNQENVLGDVQGAAVGDTITAKNAATTTQLSTALKTLIGDVEISKFVMSTQSGINDQLGFQLENKMKSLLRLYQNYLINGVSSTTQFDGLLTLVDAGKTIASTGADGDVLSFAKLDELMDQVTDKGGDVDFLMMSRREVRAYKDLCRGLGGAGIVEATTLPNGKDIIAYNGVPIFANDWIPVNQTRGASTNASTILAGTLDDGSHLVGITGITSINNPGMVIEDVGTHQSRDEYIWRVKMYASLVLNNKNGLSVATGIVP